MPYRLNLKARLTGKASSAGVELKAKLKLLKSPLHAAYL